jgi:flagella basal body P-ring formation protein FlgA
METLNPDRVAATMRNALQRPAARIELMETNPATVPVGTIEFTRENLGAPAAPDSKTPVLWRGDVIYAGNRRFQIWAKVRITAPVSRLVAVEALRSGVPIKTSQVRAELVEGFPEAFDGGLLPDQIKGMVLVRPLAVGALIRPDNLTRPNEVNRGDFVSVDVQFGAARLSLTGRAESSGRIGDTIAIRNPDSSKVFQALVEGTDQVTVGPHVAKSNRAEGD